MKKLAKSWVALGVSSALAISAAHAAKYEVIDTGELNSLKFTYGQKINNAGDVVLSATDYYNFPVQFQYLDEDDFDFIVRTAERDHERVFELEDIEDEDALRAGNPTANDLSWVIRYLSSAGNNVYQKIGNTASFLYSGGQHHQIPAFDQTFAGTDQLTHSTLNFVNGINDSGVVYGNATAPYLPVDFTDVDGDLITFWLRDFDSRGYISFDNGQSVQSIISPEASYYGGESAILDMNGLTAVGYASTELNVNIEEVILNTENNGCADPDVLEDMPAEACIQSLSSSLYHLKAYKWEFDAAGNIISEQDLGLLVTPHEDDERNFKSYAQAINSQGVAVGFSHGWVDENETDPSENERLNLYAVVYKDGEVTSLTDDHGKYFDSRAYDINDDGIAVGHVNYFSGFTSRTKFFHIDTNKPKSEMEMIFPDGFFNSSSSTARAINNNGLIVGNGEFESHSDNGGKARRTHGFLYDLNTETFTDLNDFLTCSSGYTIIEARGINENNEIAATAIVRIPRKNIKGELVLDDNGEQVMEDVARAVVLKPVNGEVEDCSKVDGTLIKRKGASFGFGLLALMLTFGFRRRS